MKSAFARRSISVLLALAYPALAGAQASLNLTCGPAQGTSYSSNYQKATASLERESIKQAQALDTAGGYGPIWGSLDYSQSADVNRLNSATLSVTDSRAIVAAEIKDRGAQIVSECLYRMCWLNTVGDANAAMVQSQVVGDICRTALGGSSLPDSAWTSNKELDIFPRSQVVVFGPGETEKLIRVKVGRTVTQSIVVLPEVRHPFPGESLPTLEFVGADDTGHRFARLTRRLNPFGDTVMDVDGQKTTTAVLRVRRPSDLTRPRFESLDFTMSGTPAIKATFNLTIVPDESIMMAPPDIGCGSMNARVYLKGWESGQGDIVLDEDATRAVRAVPFGKTHLERSVHRAYAGTYLAASCDNVTGQAKDDSLKRFEFSFAGHTEAPEHPGDIAEAGWSPDWSDEIVLGGSENEFEYDFSVRVTAQFAQNRHCRYLLEEQRRTVATHTISNYDGSAPEYFGTTLPPGRYQLGLRCDDARISLKGAADKSEALTMSIEAKRVRKADKPSVTAKAASTP